MRGDSVGVLVVTTTVSGLFSFFQRCNALSVNCSTPPNTSSPSKSSSKTQNDGSSPSVTFVRQLRNSRLQRYRRFLKGVPALHDKRRVRGSYRLIRQAGLNDN